jgi:hypothetical protein
LRLRWLSTIGLWLAVAGCTLLGPPSPSAPNPGIILPGSGFVTVLPTLRPSRSPMAPPRPNTQPSQAPAAPNPCPTPPTGVCCAIVHGSIQGSVTGPDGAAVTDVQVTARSTNGMQFGGCAATATSSVVNGRYAFNAVPFGMTLILEATAPGYARYEQTLTLAKGPLLTHDVTLQKAP